jgi:polar amino acid transport system permease protein
MEFNWEIIWSYIPLMDLRWSILTPYAPLFVQGVWMTVKLTVIALVLGMLAGLLIGLVTSQKVTGWRRLVRGIAVAYVGFFRGTPLFVQILLVHFALMPTLIHPDHGWLLTGDAAAELRQNYGAFMSGAVALTLNAAAYISEIVRAGIASIAHGQTQAAYSLGLTRGQTMRHIILPQALRRMVPPLVNESITLLKDSSLVSAIGLAELAMAARTVAGAYSRYWEPYLAISAMYLVMTWLLTVAARKLETPDEHGGR